jgi:hypothetical protein
MKKLIKDYKRYKLRRNIIKIGKTKEKRTK